MTYSQEEAIELDLIQVDAQVALSALLASLGHHDAASIVFAGFPPAILVAEETHNYFAQRNRTTRLGSVDGQLFDNFGNAVKKVRARIKLLDDNDPGPANLVNFMETVRERSRILFAHPTSRIIQAISSPFRPDIGVYFANKYLIATTHALLPTLGVTREVVLSAGPGEFNKLHEFVHEFAKSLGVFFLQLQQVLALHSRELNLQSKAAIPQSFATTYNDFVARKFYRHVEENLSNASPNKCAMLTVCLAQTNQALLLLPALLGQDANLVRRMQYLTAYHGSEALRNSLLTTPIWLETRPGDLLNHKQLRNFFAHYELRKAAKFAIGASDAFRAVVSGVADVNSEVVFTAAEERLQRMSEYLGSALTKDELRPIRALLGEHT